MILIACITCATRQTDKFFLFVLFHSAERLVRCRVFVTITIQYRYNYVVSVVWHWHWHTCKVTHYTTTRWNSDTVYCILCSHISLRECVTVTLRKRVYFFSLRLRHLFRWQIEYGYWFQISHRIDCIYCSPKWKSSTNSCIFVFHVLHFLSGHGETTWCFSQIKGALDDDVTDADIISCVEFNHDGELLATGDKGGRVVIFQVNSTLEFDSNKHIDWFGCHFLCW